jgi:hypothetical protein
MLCIDSRRSNTDVGGQIIRFPGDLCNLNIE